MSIGEAGDPGPTPPPPPPGGFGGGAIGPSALRNAPITRNANKIVLFLALPLFLCYFCLNIFLIQ